MEVPGGKRGRSQARLRFKTLHDELRRRICMLRYPPGTRLSEEQLAGEFGVSRTPIRRVLHHLEAEGLVESRHGVGTVVTDPDLATLRQIYALRMRLAELIGELDPLPRSPADIERLRALIARLDALHEQAQPAAQEFAAINIAFQEELVLAIGNVALREAASRLYYQTARLFLQALPHIDLAQEITIFRAEAAEIVAAMERGDMRAAGFVRRNHIARSFDRLTRTAPTGAGACLP
ncbi:GntR family transcriptional regulator [Geminicoccaceae bacterium 1502E]|nr:GntR family transcriptional regulator [Geminicoccaceae bacterium 1502E]